MKNCTQCKCSTRAEASIVIKFAAEPETTRECPICKQCFYQADKTWAYLEGTTDPVCLDCAGPELNALLDAKSRHDMSIHEAMDTIKAEKLEHYRNRQPALFCQVDAFHTGTEDDDGGPDDRGFAIYGNMATWELMHGSDIRVFIRATVPKDVAEFGLAEIQRVIAEGFTDGALEKDIAAEALKYAEVLRVQASDSIPF